MGPTGTNIRPTEVSRLFRDPISLGIGQVYAHTPNSEYHS